jgi:hypothetical protein
MKISEDLQKALDQVTGKDLIELNDADRGFLRARASYLNREQRKKFESVLGGETPVQKETQPETPAQTPKDPFIDNDEDDEEEAL